MISIKNPLCKEFSYQSFASNMEILIILLKEGNDAGLPPLLLLFIKKNIHAKKRDA